MFVKQLFEDVIEDWKTYQQYSMNYRYFNHLNILLVHRLQYHMLQNQNSVIDLYVNSHLKVFLINFELGNMTSEII